MERKAEEVGALVRRSVRLLLDATPAYRSLQPDAQGALADDMVRIGTYLAQPEAIRANHLAGAVTMIPAAAAGFTDLLAEVNFPQFVGGLIQGVFQAIVNSSVQQMEAYSELVKSVAQTVDQFTATPISDDDARDWLATAFPDCLVRDSVSGALRLQTGAGCAEALPRFRLLPLPGPLREIRPADLEKKLVPAARRHLAAQRQQLAASMVLMGINRIVATKGRIET